ncbi:DUF6153 family protein [Agrococcus sp. BE272]|uniref:DUF6153 family protein n=1 Tax=Agrococcus sp. BE272 TaxID=2817727 RepID=UPI002855755C|nr:DUF6153 family protein [Agrococcus sp. BE272]MDR7233194.1 hypothetical protein [Agrococcus sp. BE272]
MRVSWIDARRSISRRLRSAALIAAALIIGLLGMHTLSGHDSHDPVIASAAAPAAEHHEEAECECASPSPEHSMALMACVLALLVGLVVLHAPRRGHLHSAPWTRAGATLERAPRALPRPRPPSLTLLSISRT